MSGIVINPEEGPVHDRGGGVRTRYLVTRELGARQFLSGVTEFDPGASLPSHWHNCEESVVVIDGVASFECGDRTYEMLAGEATWLAAGAVHRFANRSAAPLRILWTYGSANATRTIAETGETFEVGASGTPQPAINPIAERGFGSAADAYEMARPSYPPDAVEWLRVHAGLGPDRTVVDLAAGTGKLSRPLAATGARVIAVEPVAPMRALIGDRIEALAGTAEEIPLPDGSADIVAVGQAFHWFDGLTAIPEIHRVLRHDGRLVLLWNVRHTDNPLAVAIEEVIGPYCASVPRVRTGQWREAFAATGLFGPFEVASFDHDHVLDADGLVGRVASISAIAALPEAKRAEVLERIRPLAGGGDVTMGYRCDVFLAVPSAPR
jgi:SAM-dependent methyltransferase/quercetin dioxygenase-like cupin family protein